MARTATAATAAHGNLTPETFEEHRQEVAAATRALEEAQGIRRAALKRAKGAGINTSKLVEALRMRKLEPEVVETDFRDLAKYLAWMGMPVGFQADLLAPGDDQPLTDKALHGQRLNYAEQEGYDRGLAGGVVEECSHPQGSELATAWLKGLRAGREFLERSGEAEHAKVSQPRRRGRPPRAHA